MRGRTEDNRDERNQRQPLGAVGGLSDPQADSYKEINSAQTLLSLVKYSSIFIFPPNENGPHLQLNKLLIFF